MLREPPLLPGRIPLYPGTILHYRFGESGGFNLADTVKDLGPLGNHGQPVNSPIWVPGRYGLAMQFDGVNQRVSRPANASIHPTDFTVSCWIYFVTHNASWQGIVDLGIPWVENWTIVSRDVPANQYGVIAGIYFAGGLVSFAYPSQGQFTWRHYALTKNGQTCRFYQNGTFFQQFVGVGAYSQNVTRELAIGARSGGTVPSNTRVDDVLYLNRPASDLEIRQIYESGRLYVLGS